MDIHYYLNQFIGKRVFAGISGGEYEDSLVIDLEEEERFLIWSDWRIEQWDTVLCSSWETPRTPDGPLACTARLLEKKTIQAIELTKQHDLTIRFEEGYCVKVFCIISYSQAEGEDTVDYNWQLGLPTKDVWFGITNNFKMEAGKYY